MINNKYKLIALILASCALLFFLIGVILYGTSSGNVSEESIEITSEVDEIEVGWNYQLEVKKKIDDNHHLEYKSSNDDILTISDTGYMNAIKSGEVIVTVRVKENNKVSDSITINVIEPKNTLTLSEKSIYLLPNEERKIYVYNTNPEGYLTWESSDEYIATVNDGLIKGLNYGETEVKVVNEEEVSAIIKVKVLSPEEEEAIELQDIYIAEENVGLDVGEKLQLTVIFDPRDVTDKSLVWNSSNPNAVIVSENGLLTAVGDGNATISAKAYNGLIAKCETTSTTHVIKATGITLNQDNIKLYVGDAHTIKATITPSNTTSKNISWTSSNNSVATVKAGLIIALKEGTTTITATTNNGKTASAKVTVIKKIVEPYSVSLDKTNATINIGGKVTLVPTITPSNASNKSVSWISSDPKIATVSNGVVTGIKDGTATITVKTSNGKTATSKITVSKETINVKSISLNTTNIDLNAGSTYTLKVSYTPSDATNQSVTWSSNNTNVASVSNGVVRAIRGGTATITARTSNGITATCTVNVSKADDVITIRKRTSNYTGSTIAASISAKSGTIKTITYYSNPNCTTKTNTSNASIEGGPPKESGTYYVIVETSGNSNYNGTTSSCTEAVVINKKKATITCTNKPYNGKPQVIATCNGGTISNATQTNVGSYQIACRGTGAYSDATGRSCQITPRSISQATVTGLVDVQYTGSPINQTPTVSINIDGETRTLTNNTDYTYTIKNNINAGNASVIISGKGNYNGSKTVYFKILKEPATITCQNKTFNGTTQTIAICNGGTATNASKRDAGDYEVRCTPDSSHSAPEPKTCSITPYNFRSNEISFSEIPSKPYTGSPITNISFTAKIRFSGMQTDYTLVPADYTYTISNNINAGPARVTITGKGNLRGNSSTAFVITKAQATITCQNKVYNDDFQTIATCNGGTLSNAYQKNVGGYKVSCTGDINHLSATESNGYAKTCYINQAVDIPTVTHKTVQYSGNPVTATVSAKTCYNTTCTIVYYINSSCSDGSRTNSSQTGGGAATSGGPPKVGGGKEYWVKATSLGSPQGEPQNYLKGTSACTKAITIN